MGWRPRRGRAVGSRGGAQDSKQLYCWEVSQAAQGEAGPRMPSGKVSRTLTLGPTRPGAPASPGTPCRTRRVIERLETFMSGLWLSIPPLSSDCRPRAGMWAQISRASGAPRARVPLSLGHQKRSDHLNRLQIQRAPCSPGHLVFHLHLGDREGQEVPGSQSDKH